MTQHSVDIVPLTLPEANRLVTRLHRHHAALPAGFGWFCCGAVVDGEVVGWSLDFRERINYTLAVDQGTDQADLPLELLTIGQDDV